MGAARYLLMTKPPEQFDIKLQDDDTMQNYILRLSSKKSWSAYKNYMQAEIKKLKKELSELDSTQVLYTQTKKNLDQLLLQEENTQKIDALIHDGNLQKSLISQDERAYLAKTKTIELIDISPALRMTVDEMINQSMEYAEKLYAIDAINHMEAPLTTASEFLFSIPLIHDFAQGLNFFQESYEAIRSPKTPQRKMEIAAGLVGSLISIGLCVLGLFLVASAALYAVPIVIVSLIVGIYSVVLYRDGYVLYQAKKQTKKSKHKIKTLESEIIQIKEIIISDYLKAAQLTERESEIKIIQQVIDKTREELVNVSQKNSSDEKLFYEITELCLDRNEMILQHPGLHQDILEKFYSHPYLASLSLQKTNIVVSLHQLSQARNQARKKFIISILSCLAVGLGLAAVCAAGESVWVLALTGGVLLAGSTLARLYVTYQEKKKKSDAVSGESSIAEVDELYEDDYALI